MSDRSNQRDERGASAVEYGLLIAGIAALIVLTVFAFGNTVKNVLFHQTCESMVAQTNAGTCG